MLGTVAKVNPRNNLVAIQREEGCFVICRAIAKPAPKTGDKISGNFNAFGRETLHNLTSRAPIKVFIIHTRCSMEEMLSLLE